MKASASPALAATLIWRHEHPQIYLSKITVISESKEKKNREREREGGREGDEDRGEEEREREEREREGEGREREGKSERSEDKEREREREIIKRERSPDLFVHVPQCVYASFIITLVEALIRRRVSTSCH